MNQSDEYFQSSYNNHNLQYQKWRLNSNLMSSQPIIKIDFCNKSNMMLQLPNVFMTSRQNQQKQSFSEVPKRNRKSSQISLNSLEVSPKITKMNQNKNQIYKDLTELQKSHCQFKKSLNKVKKQHQIVNNNCEINTINPNSSFYLNGVKLYCTLQQDDNYSLNYFQK